MEKNESKKVRSGNQVKELVKPRKLDASLIKEVEALCPELQNCGQLRRLGGQNVEQDSDILF